MNLSSNTSHNFSGPQQPFSPSHNRKPFPKTHANPQKNSKIVSQRNREIYAEKRKMWKKWKQRSIKILDEKYI